MGSGDETNVHLDEENSHLDFLQECRCCGFPGAQKPQMLLFFLRHTCYLLLHATTCMRCTVNCMQPQEQILCSVLNSQAVCLLPHECFITPALCSVEFTMHIWDITTPAVCLCVCVPTDRFMSPTQCVGGQGGWFTLWCCTLCGLF